MLSRVLSGLLMAASIIGILLFTPMYVLGLVVFAVLPLAVLEFQAISRPQADPFDRVTLVVATYIASLYPAGQALGLTHYGQHLALVGGFGLLCMARLFRPRPIEESMARLAADALAFIYVSLTFPLIFLLRGMPEGGYVVLMVMAITFGADTGAYFCGRLFGRRKLYELISPNKTMAGALGAVTTGVLVAFVARSFFPGHDTLTVVDCIVLGAGGALLGICGDLFESMLKRAYGVKDSGTLIPGHGGALDRIDALLFVGPFAYFYLELFAR